MLFIFPAIQEFFKHFGLQILFSLYEIVVGYFITYNVTLQVGFFAWNILGSFWMVFHEMVSYLLIYSSDTGADTGKKWTSSKFPGFPILSNVSPIFHNIFPIFHYQNFSRFASANVAVVWIRAWDIISVPVLINKVNLSLKPLVIYQFILVEKCVSFKKEGNICVLLHEYKNF